MCSKLRLRTWLYISFLIQFYLGCYNLYLVIIASLTEDINMCKEFALPKVQTGKITDDKCQASFTGISLYTDIDDDGKSVSQSVSQICGGKLRYEYVKARLATYRLQATFLDENKRWRRPIFTSRDRVAVVWSNATYSH